MSGEEPTIDDLKRRQHETEVAERERLAEAETDDEADRHRRRADKAHYLREKLSQQQESESGVAGDQEQRDA